MNKAAGCPVRNMGHCRGEFEGAGSWGRGSLDVAFWWREGLMGGGRYTYSWRIFVLKPGGLGLWDWNQTKLIPVINSNSLAYGSVPLQNFRVGRVLAGCLEKCHSNYCHSLRDRDISSRFAAVKSTSQNCVFN